MTQDRLIYLARLTVSPPNERWLKVGVSCNPERRLKSLRWGRNTRARILECVRGTIHQEREIHRALRRFETLLPEWYRDSAKVREAIRCEFVELLPRTVRTHARPERSIEAAPSAPVTESEETDR